MRVPFTCLDCESESVKLVAQDGASKTWRCSSCDGACTIERNGADWRLFFNTELLASRLSDVAALLGMRDSDLIDLFEGRDPKEPKQGSTDSGQASEPELEDYSQYIGQPGYPGPDPDPAFLASLGRNIPRRYAHLVSEEDRMRESDVFWPRAPAVHLLADSIPDGREFIQHIDEHIRTLARLLGIEREKLAFSLASAEMVDGVIEHDRETWLSGQRFGGLVAYAGETIRGNVGGDWVAEYNSRDEWWEPFIRDAGGKLYNPWLDLYKRILEDFPCSFVASVGMEIQSSPRWRPDTSEW
jgi:hypothetical protein